MLGERRGSASVKQALLKRHRRELRRLEQDLYIEAFATLASFYRDIVAVRAGDEPVNADVAPEVEAWRTVDVSDAALLRAAERCVAAQGALPFNANAVLLIEATLLEVARLVPPVHAPVA